MREGTVGAIQLRVRKLGTGGIISCECSRTEKQDSGSTCGQDQASMRESGCILHKRCMANKYPYASLRPIISHPPHMVSQPSDYHFISSRISMRNHQTFSILLFVAGFLISRLRRAFHTHFIHISQPRLTALRGQLTHTHESSVDFSSLPNARTEITSLAHEDESRNLHEKAELSRIEQASKFGIT